MSIATPSKTSRSALTTEERVLLRDVPWSLYTQLNDNPANYHLRMTYDRGVLEIMSPSALHELYANLIDRFIQEVTTESGQALISLGSTTWRWAPDEKGLESDNCYYIARAGLVMEGDEVDLQSDPPPDLAVEVDLSHSSLPKFPVYQSLRIPEIWRFDGKAVMFFQLAEDGYDETPESVHFPWLASNTLFQLLDDQPGRDLNAWGLRIRGWVHETVLPRIQKPNH